MKLLFIILAIISFNFFVLGQSKTDYKILRENCIKGDSCTVFAYVKSPNYSKADMQKLAEDLAEKYKEKSVVNYRVFNDEKIIEAYFNGNREPSNISSDSSIYFIHRAHCGDILFYKADKNEIKVIKLRWENNELCSKSLSIF